MMNLIDKIVSGGQTGVDRAALDVAIFYNIKHGGWCPKGRSAEDGIIPAKYLLAETTTSDYSERTILNIRDSDGTLILLKSDPIGGSLLTINECKKQKKPLFICNLTMENDLNDLYRWIKNNSIKVLNVAGSRASESENIYEDSFNFLKNFISFYFFG